jgi:hypothetical protein
VLIAITEVGHVDSLVLLNLCREYARYALVDVFMTNSKKDHYNVDLGRDKNGASSYTSWVSGGKQPSSIFPTEVEKDQGVHMTYFGDGDKHSTHYGIWYSSLIVTTNGAQTYHGASGNGNGGVSWTYMRVHAYGY